MRIKNQTVETLEDVSKLIGVSVGSLTYFANNMNLHVKEHREKKTSGSGTRLITAPSGALKSVLRSIKDNILLEYQYPAYVFGLGGNTLKDHGMIHAGAVTTVKLDITDFYPSLKNEWVYDMWRREFDFNDETARILTKLTTLHGGLTQGFPTSSHIAAIVAEDFTQSLNTYARDHTLKFSQYVDDLNLSGKHIEARPLFKAAVTLARESGLSIKRRKTKVTSPKDGKVITGAAVYNFQTRATKHVRQRAIQALKALEAEPTSEYNQKRVRGYAGFLKHLKSSDGQHYRDLAERHLPKKR